MVEVAWRCCVCVCVRARLRGGVVRVVALLWMCAAPACNVGSVPVGEYLFNPLAANTSVNGTRFIDWFIE